jgi:uncharacterized protein
MSLHQTILTDLNTGMKERDVDRVAILRMLKAALLNAQKETGKSDDLADDEVLAILQREAKKRKEAIEAFTKADRSDLVATEQKELAVIETYLPTQFTDDEIRAIITEVKNSAPTADFGAVMGQVMKKVNGRADGNRVRQLVQESLNS